jgi:hypothetical protein
MVKISHLDSITIDLDLILNTAKAVERTLGTGGSGLDRLVSNRRGLVLVVRARLYPFGGLHNRSHDSRWLKTGPCFTKHGPCFIKGENILVCRAAPGMDWMKR